MLPKFCKLELSLAFLGHIWRLNFENLAVIQIEACFVKTLELVVIDTAAQIALRNGSSWITTIPCLESEWFNVGRDHRSRGY